MYSNSHWLPYRQDDELTSTVKTMYLSMVIGKSTPTEHPYTLIYRLRSANEGNTDMGVP